MLGKQCRHFLDLCVHMRFGLNRNGGNHIMLVLNCTSERALAASVIHGVSDSGSAACACASCAKRSAIRPASALSSFVAPCGSA